VLIYESNVLDILGNLFWCTTFLFVDILDSGTIVWYSTYMETIKIAFGLIVLTLILSLTVFAISQSKPAEAHEAGGGCYRYGSKWIGTINHQYEFEYAFNPSGKDRHAHKVTIYHNPPGGFQGYKTIDCPDRGRCPIH
jgi:hypothetical protein